MIPGITIGYLGTTAVNILTQFSEDFFLCTHSLIHHVKTLFEKKWPLTFVYATIDILNTHIF